MAENNIKYLSMDEIKGIELNILKYVHTFCENNGIKYFVNYGTLIGAIRHEGFIPWDDDIDIMMDRENYNKFIELFSNNDNSNYKIISHKIDECYCNNFIKVYDSKTVMLNNRNYKSYDAGVSIDIFPYDTFDSMSVVRKTYFWESLKLLSISKFENIQYGDSIVKDFVRRIFWLLLKPVPVKFFTKKIDKLINKYSKRDGKYYGLLASKFKYRDIFNRNIFEELIKIKFEDTYVYAPKEYDRILKQYYKNYMIIPDKNNQNYPHKITAYYRENIKETFERHMSTDELKLYQLNILKYIDSICKKYNIRYFLNYGSLLGAIRHNGFIPWDDDIDISMYREDYIRFQQVMANEDNKRYSILSKDNSDWYFQNFLVVVDKNTIIKDHIKKNKNDSHVFVDVFPVDKFEDPNFVEKAHIMSTLKHICSVKRKCIVYKDNIIKDICRSIVWGCLRFVNPRFFTKRIDNLLKKYENLNGQYEGAVGINKDKFKEIFPKGTFNDLMIHKFEDSEFPIPVNYDLILKQLYGNYMEFPSIEEREKNSHNLDAYIIK